MSVILKRRKQKNWKRGIFIVGTIAIPLLHFCIFYVYANINSFIMAFQRYDEHNNLYWTFENFEIAIDSFSSGGIGAISLRNTFIYFGIGLLQTLVFGPIFSYFSYKNIWGDTFRRIISAGTGLMSGVVMTTIVSLYFQPGGPISDIFTSAYNLDAPAQVLSDSRFANQGLFLYTIWIGLGINYYIRGAMMRIPADVLEYAKLDGVSWIRELTSIILPMCWPTIMTLIVLQSTNMLMASADVYLFTNGEYNTSTIAFWLFKQQLNAAPNSNSLYFVCALGMCLSAVMIPIVFGLRYGLGKLQERVEF